MFLEANGVQGMLSGARGIMLCKGCTQVQRLQSCARVILGYKGCNPVQRVLSVARGVMNESFNVIE